MFAESWPESGALIGSSSSVITQAINFNPAGVAAFAALALSEPPPMHRGFEGGWQQLPTDFMRVVQFGIPASLIVYGAVSLEVSRGVTLPHWMERIGDASYSIYLSHLLVMVALGRIWGASGWNGPAQSGLAFMLIAASVIGFGFFSYHWIELPLIDRARNWRLPKILRSQN